MKSWGRRPRAKPGAATSARRTRATSCDAYPHRHPQERFYSILPFLAQHGLDLIDRLSDAVEPMCPDHRVYTI
jgi:hypothetical protein